MGQKEIGENVRWKMEDGRCKEWSAEEVLDEEEAGKQRQTITTRNLKQCIHLLACAFSLTSNGVDHTLRPRR